ncbi:GEVED domain-containing protein [Luteibaculum oceani]|uniref:PKD domain-containing protein n=1 Tax=Luteibaculum oceani TaxID=1294296 RepID=A0A5C6V9G7_9FLAO|nr:GEVED domain-containing protein [Luteibaculum oceani]TXC82132.1 PKD domain-containing protein [Luteibaculum oceani]
MHNYILNLITFLIILFLVMTGLNSSGQSYCGISFSSTSDYITQVKFGTGSAPNGWTNNSGGQSANGYGNFSNNIAYRATVEPGKSYPMEVRVSGTGTQYVRVFVDWDGNGTFEYSSYFGSQSSGYVFSGNIVVPGNATNKITRIRVVDEYNEDPTACQSDTWGEAEDYSIEICDGTTMSFKSLSVNQNNTAAAPKGSNRAEIIGFNINVAGCDTKVKVKSAKFGQGDSDNITADATNARLYYTGSSNTFATTNQVGGTTAPGASFTISGIDNNLSGLTDGDNWFWLTYDIPNNANIDNYVDGELLSLTLDTLNASGIIYNVPNGDPNGKRLIVNSYCTPANPANAAGAHIQKVEIGTLSNSNTGNSIYRSFVPTVNPFDFCVGNEYDLKVNWYTDVNYIDGSVPFFVHAYFDWNRDGDFNDADEHYLVGNEMTRQYLIDGVKSGTFTAKITPPQSAKGGASVMRVSVSRDMGAYPCTGSVDGETEDYGYNLNKAGNLINTDPIVCTTGTVQFNVSNTNNQPYTVQYATDRENFTDLYQNISSASFTTQLIDTTTSFRIVNAKTECPNGLKSSDIIDIMYAGINRIESDKSQLCADDTAKLKAVYEYNAESFTATFGATNSTVRGMQVTEFPLDVSGLPANVKLNEVMLDSICITGGVNVGAAQLYYYLYAPNVNDQKRVLLSGGNGLNNVGATNKFCFTTEATRSVVGETASLSGEYKSQEPLSRLNGYNPNGTWKLMVFIDFIDGNGSVEEFSLHFGVNDGVNWSPNSAISSTTDDAPEAYPTSSTTYIASLSNKYCMALDSLPLAVLGNTAITASITDQTPTGSVCAGSSIRFDAALSDNIANPPVQWYINDQPVTGETGMNFTTNTLSDGDEVKFEFNLVTACGTYYSTDSVIVEIDDFLTPSLTLNSGSPMPICQGATVNFTADDKDFGPNPNFEWFLNGTSVQNQGKTYSGNGLNNGDVVVVKVNANYACVSVNELSDTIVVTTTTELDPNLEMTSDVNPELSCIGKEITFTVDTAFNNSGGKGSVSWFHNGKPINVTTLSTSTDTFSVGNHVIRAEYNVNSSCTKSTFVTDQVSFLVGSDVEPEITITSDRTKICDGDSIHFLVTNIKHGGSAPEIQWFLNSDPISGETGMTYSGANFNNQDEVNARLISSIECISFEQTFSGPIEVKVSELTPTAINIRSDFEQTPFCKGESILIEVDLLEGGGVEPNIEWFLNDLSIRKRKFTKIALDSLKNGDKVYAKLHPNSVCPTPVIPTSDTLTFSVLDLPFVDFQPVVSGADVQFIPSDTNFTAYAWQFGNGQSSQQVKPSMQYEESGEYEVCLSVEDTNGCVNVRCKMVSYSVPVGLNEHKGYAMSLFPNPVKEKVFITHNLTSVKSIKVMSQDGKLVSTNYVESDGRITVPMNDVVSGVYLIQVYHDNGVLSSKFTKL